MNADVKKKWVEALRSGEYKQGQGRLQRDGAFCCLGVLCDLHAKETGLKWMTHAEAFSPVWPYSSDGALVYIGRSAELPDEVVSWAGVEDSNPQVGAKAAYVWNDAEGKTFTEIADLIEEHL